VRKRIGGIQKKLEALGVNNGSALRDESRVKERHPSVIESERTEREYPETNQSPQESAKKAKKVSFFQG